MEHIESQLDTDQNMNRDVFQDSQVKAPCQGSMFLSLFELAEKCTARLKKNRPTMEDVSKVCLLHSSNSVFLVFSKAKYLSLSLLMP